MYQYKKKVKLSKKLVSKKRNRKTKLVGGGGNHADLKRKAMVELGINPDAKTTSFSEDMQIIKKIAELRTGKQFIIAKTPPINYVTQSYTETPQREPMTKEAFNSDKLQYRPNSVTTYADYLKTFKDNQAATTTQHNKNQ
jgi:hypothetical protein